MTSPLDNPPVDLVGEIMTAFRSLDPIDYEGMARRAVEIVRSHRRVVGYINPRTGALHRMKVDFEPESSWLPMFTDE